MNSDEDLDSSYSDEFETDDGQLTFEVQVRPDSAISIETSDDELAVMSDRDSASNDGSATSEVRVFDTDLSSQHLYLGNNFKILSGRVFYDEETQHTLEILNCGEVVLVPGQTLPLTLFDAKKVEMLRRCIAKDRTFGVICKRTHLPKDGLKYTAENIGTTVEILEYQLDGADIGIRLKAKARQRFKIISLNRTTEGVTATIKILPEVILPDPLHEIQQVSLNKHRTSHRLRCRRRDAWQTAWPEWVYRQYDTSRLVKEMKENLSVINHAKGHTGARINFPDDPTALSFWVAQSIPVIEDQVIFLLKLDSPIQRLRWELSMIQKLQIVCCNHCQNRLGSLEDAFFMSNEGTQATYVNPRGYVYKTLTLYKVSSIEISGVPTSEYSWFPGYAWSIACCRLCLRHVGWKFTRTVAHLEPQEFWALCRSSFSVKSISSTQNGPVL